MTTITNPSAPAMLPPIDRLRKLAGWRHVAEVPAGRLWKRDGFIFETEPVFSEIEIEPTFPELRADLAAKLEADARPGCPTRGSVAGQVFAIVNELERSASLSLREHDGQFWVVQLQGERTCDGRWLPRWHTPIESLECAHDWGLL